MIPILLYISILDGIGIKGDCVISHSEMANKDIARMEFGSS